MILKKKLISGMFFCVLLIIIGLALSSGSNIYAAETLSEKQCNLYENFDNENENSLNFLFWKGSNDATMNLCEGINNRSLMIKGLIGTSANNFLLYSNTDYSLTVKLKVVSNATFTIIFSDVKTNDSLGCVRGYFSEGESTSFEYGEGAEWTESEPQSENGIYTFNIDFSSKSNNAYIKFESTASDENSYSLIDDLSIYSFNSRYDISYENYASDNFEDNGGLNTALMLNDQQELNLEEIITENSIEDKSLMYDFSTVQNVSNRYYSCLRVSPSKINISNGFYKLFFQAKDSGVLTYHIQVKKYSNDVVTDEYYFNAKNLARMDTGNGTNLIGQSEFINGINNTVLYFSCTDQCYIDFTFQLDSSCITDTGYNSYIIFDNFILSQYGLETYPEKTYKSYISENYTKEQSTVLSLGTGASIGEYIEEGYKIGVNTSNVNSAEINSLNFGADYYCLYFLAKTNNLSFLNINIKKENTEIHNINYDLENISAEISLDNIKTDIIYDSLKKTYMIKLYFYTQESGSYSIGISGQKKSSLASNTYILFNRIDLLQAYENSFIYDSPDVNTSIDEEISYNFENNSFGITQKYKNAINGNGDIWFITLLPAIVISVVVIAALLLYIFIFRKKTNKGNRNENKI
jgi:hypothetical protein